MKTFEFYVCIKGSNMRIQANGRDSEQAKAMARRMYGNDIQFYQYHIVSNK